MQQIYFLRMPAVEQRTGLKPKTVHKLIKLGQFPKQIPLTDGNAVAWRSDQIEEWMAARIADADHKLAVLKKRMAKPTAASVAIATAKRATKKTSKSSAPPPRTPSKPRRPIARVT